MPNSVSKSPEQQKRGVKNWLSWCVLKVGACTWLPLIKTVSSLSKRKTRTLKEALIELSAVHRGKLIWNLVWNRDFSEALPFSCEHRQRDSSNQGYTVQRCQTIVFGTQDQRQYTVPPGFTEAPYDYRIPGVNVSKRLAIQQRLLSNPR
jgi:hypothetical protein